MPYREPLPPDCPPPDALEITGRRTVYRLVRRNPPNADDFRSQRAEKPSLKLRPNITECQARGVSVFANRSAAEFQLKYRRFRGRLVCQVTLSAGAGRIRQTGKGIYHYTWWPLAAYDILANCRVE